MLFRLTPDEIIQLLRTPTTTVYIVLHGDTPLRPDYGIGTPVTSGYFVQLWDTPRAERVNKDGVYITATMGRSGKTNYSDVTEEERLFKKLLKFLKLFLSIVTDSKKSLHTTNIL